MADVYVNALTTISTEPTTTDSIVAVNRNTNEGKIIDYNLLADAILNKIASKQFSGLDTTSKLLVGAINELGGDISSLNSMLGAKIFHVYGKTSYTIASTGMYVPALFFGIIKSQRFMAIINPGAGTPAIDYVFRNVASQTIQLTGLTNRSYTLNAENTANDFYVIGCDSIS